MLQMMEAMYWHTVVSQAAQGNPEAQEELEAQNRLRQENAQPTIQQELQLIMNKAQQQM